MPKFPYSVDDVTNAVFYINQHGRGVAVDFDAMVDAAAQQWVAEHDRDQRDSLGEVEDRRSEVF